MYVLQVEQDEEKRERWTTFTARINGNVKILEMASWI